MRPVPTTCNHQSSPVSIKKIRPTSDNERPNRSPIGLYRLEHEQFCCKVESREGVSTNTEVVHTAPKSISSVQSIHHVMGVNSLQGVINVVRSHSSN